MWVTSGPGPLCGGHCLALLYCLCSSVKGQLTVFLSLFLGSLFRPLGQPAHSFTNTTLSPFCSFRASWSGVPSVLCLCPSASISCGLFWVFASPRKLRNRFVDIHKVTQWFLTEIPLHRQIKLGGTDILTTLRLPVHEHEVSVHLLSSS